MHDIRKGEKYLIGVRGQGRRVGLLQSGEVSQKILCHKHEGATQLFDDAAIRLMRSFDRKRSPAYEGLAWKMPNPKPRELTLFAHAVIWRHLASWQADGTGPSYPTDLIPVLQGIVFGGDEPLPVLIMHGGRTHDGEAALFALAPTETSLDGVPFIRFEAGGFVFLLLTERGMLAPSLCEFQTIHNPLTVVQLDHGDLRSDPNIMRYVLGAKAPPGF